MTELKTVSELVKNFSDPHSEVQRGDLSQSNDPEPDSIKRSDIEHGRKPGSSPGNSWSSQLQGAPGSWTSRLLPRG